MKIELNKIYVDGNGDPIVIYGKKGSNFYGLDVKNHEVYTYDEQGKCNLLLIHGIASCTEYDLLFEYDKVPADFAVQKGIILKDSQGWRVWLKANIQGLPYPLIGMYVDRINEQAMYKETEKFTIAKDNEIEDLNLDDVLMAKFKQYWGEL